MRLFLALNLPKKERQRIERAARPLREQELPVRWVGLENFHVTLKFLGDVRPDKVESIQEIMDKVASTTVPFAASVEGFGAFPTIRKPAVLWAGVEATRAFHPHLTLGRASARGGAGAFRGLDDLTASLEVESHFTVRTVDLMRSQSGKDGPRYTVLHKARLTGEA